VVALKSGNHQKERKVMELTNHALKRKRQRGFSNHSLEVIEKYGRYGKAPGGMTEIFLGKKESQDLIRQLKRDINLLEKLAGSIVITTGDLIITMYKSSA
jgi:hypothetical protein